MVNIEAVRVFHVEFAHANEAAARARLVAELCLYLVDDERQVAVAVDIGLDHVGQQLFVSGREHERTLAAVVQPEEFAAHRVTAAGQVPVLERLEGGHLNFLTARGVHFLSNDLLDLSKRAEREGHVAIDARGRLVDHSCAEHQAVACKLCLCWIVPQGLAEHSGHSHS